MVCSPRHGRTVLRQLLTGSTAPGSLTVHEYNLAVGIVFLGTEVVIRFGAGCRSETLVHKPRRNHVEK
jgi:hypothetical protein